MLKSCLTNLNMPSPSFKNVVGPRRIRPREVRREPNTAHCSEGSDNLLLNTASWPELPKSQHVHSWKASNTAEKKPTNDDKHTCEHTDTSVKSPKTFSGTSITQTQQTTNMSFSLVASHSAEKHRDNSECHGNSNKDTCKDDVLGKRIEQFGSDSNQTSATGIDTNDLPKCTSDDRRMKQAKKRSALKEEKKKMREAEILRKRIEPKGQSVRVISHKILEMVMKSDRHNIAVNSQQKCDISVLNFPSLEEATKNTKSKSIKDNLHDVRNIESCTNENIPVASTVTSKKNKHKKPLEIDIHNLIKDSSRKSCDKAYRSTKGHQHLKPKQNVSYIGNQLDSSNPERKRGKKRERPKKKRFTLLKAAILEARAIRKHLRDLEEQSKNAADLPEINFCKVELNEPDNIDLQHTLKTCCSEKLEDSDKIIKCEAKGNENLNENISSADVGLLKNMSMSGLLSDSHTLERASNLQQSKSLNVPSCSKAAAKESDEDNNKCNEKAKNVTEQLKLSTQKFPHHSRKFREYCDHILSKDLDSAVKSLIESIVKFQDRLYQRDPIKAFAKRRYVVGFREVKKYLQLKRLKLVILAPDLEVAKTKGGTDDAVTELKDISSLQCVPYVFALNRRTLGYITLKKVGVSCIGVVNYEGAENNFASIIEAMSVARIQYNKLVNNVTTMTTLEKEEPEKTKDKISDCIAASLLSKLREKSTEDEPCCRDAISPFLAAIDRITISEDCSE